MRRTCRAPLVALAGVWLLVASSCAGGTIQSARQQGSITELMPSIGQPDNGWCDSPGGVLLIDGPNGTHLQAAGLADIASNTPVVVTDRFEVGSITKSFTVVLALQLQERGLLSLDDLMSKWLPAEATSLPFGDQITLRQLASNRSGVWDYADPLIAGALDTNDTAELAKGYKPSELIDLVSNYGSPEFEPGARYSYSSSNFILLGMAVEAASGRSLSDLYQDRIFEPVEMADTTYPLAPPPLGSIVSGYFRSHGKMVDVTGWNPSQGGAAGAIISTATDIGRYAMALVHGDLLSDESLKQMFEPGESDNMAGSMGYGLGVMLYGDSAVEGVGHGGQTPGFTTAWIYVNELDSVVVFLTNSAACDGVFDLPSRLTEEMFAAP